MEIKRSNRRTLSIEVTQDAQVIVRAPYSLPLSEIEKLVAEKSSWIEKQIKKAQAKQQSPIQKLTAEQLKTLADQAQLIIPKRTAYFAQKLHVTYGRITIRNQKTCWGSCSDKGNLSFNCLLMLAPSDVLDYIVVHELCHRKDMSHSKNFWKQVENILPDYKTQEKWLKENGPTLIKKVYS